MGAPLPGASNPIFTADAHTHRDTNPDHSPAKQGTPLPLCGKTHLADLCRYNDQDQGGQP